MAQISRRNPAGCVGTIRRVLLVALPRSFSNTAKIRDAHGRQVESVPTTVSFKEMAHGNPLGLPRLPIPALQDTMSRYLEVRSLVPLGFILGTSSLPLASRLVKQAALVFTRSGRHLLAFPGKSRRMNTVEPFRSPRLL